jgi:hypothetical protein
VQKTDLIAELKRTKDIPGIKKLKVERAQVEKTQEQNLMTEISKAFNVTNFVDQVRTFYLFFISLKCIKEIVKMSNRFNDPLKNLFIYIFLCSLVLKYRIVDFFSRSPRRTARET